jgi:hypothetical protein
MKENKRSCGELTLCILHRQQTPVTVLAEMVRGTPEYLKL